jgi:hypothetical protein
MIGTLCIHTPSGHPRTGGYGVGGVMRDQEKKGDGRNCLLKDST